MNRDRILSSIAFDRRWLPNARILNNDLVVACIAADAGFAGGGLHDHHVGTVTGIDIGFARVRVADGQHVVPCRKLQDKRFKSGVSNLRGTRSIKCSCRQDIGVVVRVSLIVDIEGVIPRFIAEVQHALEAIQRVRVITQVEGVIAAVAVEVGHCASRRRLYREGIRTAAQLQVEGFKCAILNALRQTQAGEHGR